MYPNIIPSLLTSMVCVALVAGLAVFSPGVPLLSMLAFWVYQGLGRPPQHSA